MLGEIELTFSSRQVVGLALAVALAVAVVFPSVSSAQDDPDEHVLIFVSQLAYHYDDWIGADHPSLHFVYEDEHEPANEVRFTSFDQSAHLGEFQDCREDEFLFCVQSSAFTLAVPPLVEDLPLRWRIEDFNFEYIGITDDESGAIGLIYIRSCQTTAIPMQDDYSGPRNLIFQFVPGSGLMSFRISGPGCDEEIFELETVSRMFVAVSGPITQPN